MASGTGTETLGVGRDGHDGLCRRLEQQAIDRLLVPIGDLRDLGRLDEERAKALSRHPIGFLGEPDDIAYMVLYLASDESKFVTGAEMVVDGGYLAV